jgi:hypothetical protein
MRMRIRNTAEGSPYCLPFWSLEGSHSSLLPLFMNESFSSLPVSRPVALYYRRLPLALSLTHSLTVKNYVSHLILLPSHYFCMFGKSWLAWAFFFPRSSYWAASTSVHSCSLLGRWSSSLQVSGPFPAILYLPSSLGTKPRQRILSGVCVYCVTEMKSPANLAYN